VFVVLHAEAVPEHLRGYVDRFLFEVSTSLYVGNLSRKVATQLWEVINEHQKDGSAAMILATSTTEQGFELLVQGSSKTQPVDFDGLTLTAWSRKIASHAH